jgi:hypothetical protein
MSWNMNKFVATIFTFILLTQIASFSFDEIRPEIDREESLQGDENWEVSGRNNTSCGTDPTMTDLWASTDSSTWGTWTNAVYGYYDVNCTIPGKSYTLEATIYESTGVYQSYSFWNWTETNDHEYMSEAWSNLSAGSYCVNATLWDVSGSASNYVDSDYPCFTLSSNNTGGNNTGGNNTGGNNTGGNNTGGNNSSAMEQIYLRYTYPATNYTTNDNLYFYWVAEDLVTNISYNATFDVYAYNVTTNTTYVIWDDYTVFDSNSAKWNPAWNGSGPSFGDSLWQIPNGTLPTGCYYASINLYDNDDGMYFDNDGFDLDVGVDCSNTGGNNTGGNNTGGNNTGGNNTGGNNTGGNNTSNNTCGNYSALPIHDSTISANSDYYIYDLSDTFYGTLIATCPMDDGRYMEVDYWITVNDYGLQTSTQNIGWDSYSSATETFTIVDSSISNYGEGSYTLHAEYYTWSNSQTLIFLDSDSSDFYIIDNSTNTGNDCTNSTQTIDGWLSFVGIDPVYDINSPFGGEMHTCWSPGQESMSLTAWLNSSTGSVMDVQAYSGSNWWTTQSGAQPLTAIDGNWMFPIHQSGSIFAVDYAPLNIPVGDYCFEGLLKVYDGNTFVHVDHQTACFTVVDSSVGPGPCVGGNDTYPTGLEWITVNPVSTMSSGVVGLGDPVANHFEIGGLSNAGDCNATYKFAFNLVRLSGGTGGSGVDYAYPSDTSMSATGICVGTTTCQFDIVKYPSVGCYTVHASLYSYPANQLLTNDQWEWWQVGNSSCGSTNTPPEVTSVVISPSSPLDTDILVCSYVFSDADNDPDNSLIAWTVNGVAAPSTSAILDSGYSDGDFVTCAVLAHDGTDNGNIGTSTVLVDSNTSGGSSGGLPSIGVIGTLAAIAVSFVAVIRREKEE